MRFLRFLRRLPPVQLSPARATGRLRNTGSIHMWCCAAAVAPGQRNVYVLVAASLSLFLTAAQIILIRFVLMESSQLSCGAHTDCAEGNFCNAWNPRWRAPRCDDCYRVLEDPDLNDTACGASKVSFRFLSFVMSVSPRAEGIQELETRVTIARHVVGAWRTWRTWRTWLADVADVADVVVVMPRRGLHGLVSVTCTCTCTCTCCTCHAHVPVRGDSLRCGSTRRHAF